MTHLAFDCIGFDLDGTLLETSGDLAEAVNHVIAPLGLEGFTAHSIRPFVGRGSHKMLERALAARGRTDADELTERLLPELTEFYAAHLAVHTRPFPGAVAALEGLAALGLRLAVCTNKVERLALPLIAQLGLTRHFATIVCGDTVGALKPDPAPLRAMMERAGAGRWLFVGDTSNDTGAARAAGLPCVALSFGFCDGNVRALGADAVIDRYEQLVPLVQAWPAAR